MARPTAKLVTALVAGALTAACGRSTSGACPGQPIGRFAFSGTRDLAPVDGAPPACPAEAGYGDAATVAFSGTLSSDPETLGAAFCSGRALAATLFGLRTGDAVTVEASTGGAVLGGCGASCAAELTVILTGTVERDASGAVTGFAGDYVERMQRSDGDCGACALPCEARYHVTGAPIP